MVNVKLSDGKTVSLNITKELQDMLLKNPDITTKKAVISNKKDSNNNAVQEIDENGDPKFTTAVISQYPKVYFDENGNFYFNVFRSIVLEDGKEVLVTNYKIKTKDDCNLYGKGLLSHHQIISGSELWDNGTDSITPHRESISKGDPNTKIVVILTRKEVLDISLKPTGDSLIAKIANSTESEKAAMIEQLLGTDIASMLAKMKKDIE